MRSVDNPYNGDKQAIFDDVVEHLRKQEVKAIVGGSCRYRELDSIEGDLRCAVGGVLPDELYDPEMEGNDIYCVVEGFPSVEEFFGKGNTVGFLRALQKVHDYGNEEEWENGFERIAEEYNLTYTPPQGEANEAAA